MNYIDPFKSQRGDIPFYGYQAVQSISNNELTCMLQKEHYAIRFFTPFDNTFDTLEGYRMFSDIEMQLYNPTLPGKLYKDLSWKFPRLQQFISHITIEESFKQKREAIWRIIDSVKSTADSSVNRPPHFVYGHLMITHQPNLFDSSGGPIATKERNGLQFTFDTYVEQVQYANKVIKDVVQHILTKNKKKTVIIIEGDHGFRDFPHPMINYNFPNFNAIFFPEGSYTQLYDEMSPVNTFRIVLNHYFCQNLSLIKDSSIIVTYE